MGWEGETLFSNQHNYQSETYTFYFSGGVGHIIEATQAFCLSTVAGF